MKNKKMGTTRHAFTKSILHILTENTHSKLLFHFLRKRMGGRVGRYVQKLCLRCHNIGQFIMEKLSISKKMLLKYMRLKSALTVIWVLNSGFLLEVQQMMMIYVKNIINLQNISFCLTWPIIRKIKIIQYKTCEISQMKKYYN